jgi:hypothetical protein
VVNLSRYQLIAVSIEIDKTHILVSFAETVFFFQFKEQVVSKCKNKMPAVP